jgi:[ribosomal protein S5]-alanine N-acetyltransferase
VIIEDRFSDRMVTSRCLLRPLDALNDANIIVKLASNSQVNRFMRSSFPQNPLLAHQWFYALSRLPIKKRGLVRAIVDRTNHQVMGVVTLAPRLRQKWVELGYWLGLPFWGRGLATEVVKKVLAVGCDQAGYRHFSAEVVASHVGSIRVLEKNGFHLASREFNVEIKPGLMAPVYGFELTL